MAESIGFSLNIFWTECQTINKNGRIKAGNAIKMNGNTNRQLSLQV